MSQVSALTAGDLQGLPNTAKQYLKKMVLESHAPEKTWEQLIESVRKRALHRKTLVLRIEELMTQNGKGKSRNAEYLIEAINAGTEKNADVLHAARALAQKSTGNKCPHRARLIDWHNQYQAQGIMGLVDAHKGRQREFYGWEIDALKHWLKPTRPKAAIIAGWLQEAGWSKASKSRVQSFLHSLPETLGKEAPQRQGTHYYQQNHTPYVIRDNTVYSVGMIYTGDGHCCDVYIADPVTGNKWRAELTVWLDLRSHYPVGWYVSKAESGVNTLFSLSQAIVEHDHVPAAIYVDNGSGFKNRMMNNQTTGYFARMGIEPLLALPQNSRGKGLVEGFFNHFEEYVGKQFATYCGHCRTDDELRTMDAKIKKGTLKLPSLLEYWDAVCRYMERYKTQHQKNLGCAPADLWAELEKTPLHTPAEAIIRPCMERVVQNWRVQLFNRKYQGDDLKHYEKKKVIVQFNLHDLTKVAVFDMQHRFICDAAIVNPIAGQTDSRLVELEQNRAKAAVKRHERHIAEIEARAKPVLTLEDSTQALSDLTAEYVWVEDELDFNPLDYLTIDNPMDKNEDSTENTGFMDWFGDDQTDF